MMGREFNFAFLPAFSLRAVELEDRVIRPWVQRCSIIYRMPSLGRFLKGRAVKVQRALLFIGATYALYGHT